MNWEEELLSSGLSERARRAGAAYAGPGAGNDVPVGERPPIGFTGGLPDPEFLPATELAAYAQEVLHHEPNAALQYGGAQGYLGLREWLAGRWGDIERMSLTPANFTLTNGSAGALSNVCDTFLDPDDVAVVEAPSFPGSIRAIRQATPRVECVPVDDDGLDVDALEHLVANVTRSGGRVRLLYTIPNFHNPTGSTLATSRRERIVEICRRSGILIVEDDAYGELGFGADPPPSLYSLAGGQGVVKLGSFSKIVAPGLRVGWCQAAPRLVDALVATRSDMGSGPFVDRVLAYFARDGALDAHIASLPPRYEAKCRTMLDALDASCTGATWNRPRGGFFIWLTLDASLDPLALGDAARDEGVVYVGGTAFFSDEHPVDGPRVGWGPGNSRYIRLAFSYVAQDQIAEGVRRLGAALRTTAGTRTR